MTLEARKETIITKIKYVNENWLLKSLEKLLSDVQIQDSRVAFEEKNHVDYSFYVGNTNWSSLAKRSEV